MQSKILFLIFALVVVSAITGVLYYFWQQKTDTRLLTENNTSELPQATPLASPMVVAFGLSPQNDSALSGTAILEDKDGKLIVTLTVTGGEDETHPAYLQSGDCPQPGSVLYMLSPVVNGTSETPLDTTLAKLRNQLPIAVNIPKSEQEADLSLSCGNLVFP